MHAGWIAAVLALGACRSDIQLGSALDAAVVVDAPPDAPGSPFAPGAYTLTFLDPVMTSCDGTLIGNEASFDGITRASANLVDGSVTLTTVDATTIQISGAVIATAFGQATIQLVPNPQASPPEFPQTIWDIQVTADFGTGPLSTLHDARYFGIDSATATTPTAMQAAVALLYETTDTTGACFATFGAVLASQ